MSDYPRFTINRSLVLPLPNRPFYDRVMAVDSKPDPAMSVEATLYDLAE